MTKDSNSENRKEDHITLAFKSQQVENADDRFYYEPLLSGHPSEDTDISLSFMGFDFALPIWVSSMTGGTEKAKMINQHLAKACGEYGMGMGLGSCRSLLDSDDRLSDFDVKHLMNGQPLFANLGIAQLEYISKEGAWHKIKDMIDKLSVDGLIVHVNPLQEFFQPEGDRYYEPPIYTIQRLIDALPDTHIIVKEVGQGMGIESLKALYDLPLAAVEFAALGGTNFSKLETLRDGGARQQAFAKLINVGHTPIDMVEMVNTIVENDNPACEHTIISGGVKDFLHGYELISKCKTRAIYGQASAFLQPALISYEALQRHVEVQREGLQMAFSFLRSR